MAGRRALPVILFLLLSLGHVMVQAYAERQPRATSVEQPSVPTYPAALLMGLLRHRTAADLQWLRVCNYAGDAAYDVTGRPSLAPLVRLVNALDPDFQQAYLLGGLLVTADQRDAAAGVDILRAGAQRFPDDTRLQFMLGAQLLFTVGDAIEAARAFQKLATLPGAPPYAAQLAASALASAGDCRTTLAMAQSMLSTSRGAVRQSLEARERHLRLECALRDLESTVRSWREAHGSNPPSLEALVQDGTLPALPEHPFGARFTLRPDGSIDPGVEMPRLHLRRAGDAGRDTNGDTNTGATP